MGQRWRRSLVKMVRLGKERDASMPKALPLLTVKVLNCEVD